MAKTLVVRTVGHCVGTWLRRLCPLSSESSSQQLHWSEQYSSSAKSPPSTKSAVAPAQHASYSQDGSEQRVTESAGRVVSLLHEQDILTGEDSLPYEQSACS